MHIRTSKKIYPTFSQAYTVQFIFCIVLSEFHQYILSRKSSTILENGIFITRFPHDEFSIKTITITTEKARKVNLSHRLMCNVFCNHAGHINDHHTPSDEDRGDSQQGFWVHDKKKLFTPAILDSDIELKTQNFH